MHICWNERYTGKVVIGFDDDLVREITRDICFHVGDHDDVELFHGGVVLEDGIEVEEEFVDLQFLDSGSNDVKDGILFGVPRDAFTITKGIDHGF
jgi:hypothetical protein